MPINITWKEIGYVAGSLSFFLRKKRDSNYNTFINWRDFSRNSGGTSLFSPHISVQSGAGRSSFFTKFFANLVSDFIYIWSRGVVRVFSELKTQGLFHSGVVVDFTRDVFKLRVRNVVVVESLGTKVLIVLCLAAARALSQLCLFNFFSSFLFTPIKTVETASHTPSPPTHNTKRHADHDSNACQRRGARPRRQSCRCDTKSNNDITRGLLGLFVFFQHQSVVLRLIRDLFSNFANLIQPERLSVNSEVII